MLNPKPINTPKNPSVKLEPDQGELYFNPKRYKSLAKSPQCDLSQHRLCSIASQFLISPCQEQDAIVKILKYINNVFGKGFIYEDKRWVY